MSIVPLLDGIIYDPAASALFAAMTVQPSAARAKLYNNLIVALKQNNLWNKRDHIVMAAAHDAQAGLIDIKNPARIGTLVNSPTFTVDRGFTGDGTTSYINTQFNPATMGVAYTQNSASMNIWRISTLNTTNPLGGRFSATGTSIAATASAYGYRCNNGTLTAPAATPPSTPLGLMVRRSDASTIAVDLNGVEQFTGTQASSAILNANILMLTHDVTLFSGAQIGAWDLGSDLTVSERVTLDSIYRTYLTGVGAM